MPTSLQDLYSIGPTLRSYKWDLSFPKLPPGVTTTGREIHLRCVSATLPAKKGSDIIINLHGHTLPEPGIYTTAGQITLSLIETIDMKITKLIRAMQQCVWQDNTGRQMDMQGNNNASFEMIIRHLDNQDTPLNGYHLKRCFWSSATPGDVNSSSDVMKPTISVTYTDFALVS